MARYEDDDDEDRPVMTLDQIFGPVPETDDTNPATHYYGLDDFTNTMSTTVSEISKSQRVRDYLEENPEARNRDIVEKLAEYGVTAADVSNAKAHLKRKGDTPAKRGRPAGSTNAATAATKSSSQTTSAITGTLAATQDAPGGSIAFGELDAAIQFVRQIGSLDRAKHLLVIIQQVQQL